MPYCAIVLLVFFNILPSSGLGSDCRTNCTSNDEQCWRTALEYRSSELIEQLFFFSSLAVHLRSYQFHHLHQINDSVDLINQSLEKYLTNESVNAHVDLNLFQEAREKLLEYCRNLTTTPVERVSEYPPLFCAPSTCYSDFLNYSFLLIITTSLALLLLIVCLVQLVQTVRSRRKTIPISRDAPLINSLSTAQASVN